MDVLYEVVGSLKGFAENTTGIDRSLGQLRLRNVTLHQLQTALGRASGHAVSAHASNTQRMDGFYVTLTSVEPITSEEIYEHLEDVNKLLKEIRTASRARAEANLQVAGHRVAPPQRTTGKNRPVRTVVQRGHH